MPGQSNDRTKYEEFWKEFGRQIKFGAYSDYGMHAELLRDLLLFWSAKEQKMVTLQEYVDKMPAEQKYIYFAAGDSSDRLAKLPSTELVLGKGYDVLLLTEDVDEFCLQILRTYPRKDAEGKDGIMYYFHIILFLELNINLIDCFTGNRGYFNPPCHDISHFLPFQPTFLRILAFLVGF